MKIYTGANVGVYRIPSFAGYRPRDKNVSVVTRDDGNVVIIDPGSANCSQWVFERCIPSRTRCVVTLTTHLHPDHNSRTFQRMLKANGLGGIAYGPCGDVRAMFTPWLVQDAIDRMRKIDPIASEQVFGILGRWMPVAVAAAYISQCWGYGPRQQAPFMNHVTNRQVVHGFEIIHLPGHTMEEVGYLDTESGIFFGGDLIQFEGPPGSAYLSFMLIDSSVRCGLESVERVIAMASAGQITGFVPSHGPIEIHPERIASRLTECRRQYLDLLDEVVDYPAARIREYLNRHSSDEYFWGKSWLERRSGACALWRAANIERENCFAL